MYMISSRFWQSVAVSTLIVSGLTVGFSHQVLAGVDLPEDKLNTEKSLRWGGAGLPSDDVVTLRDALVNSVVGKVVIDKHGEDNGAEEATGLAGLFNSLVVKDPFGEPKPGRMTIVTLWGSKEEGCFVKTLVHNAPKGDGGDPKGFVPVKLEVGVGDRVVKLTPASKGVGRAAGSTYTYVKEYTNNYQTQVKAEGSLYFAENTFAVNAKVADLFRNAPKGDAKIRLTFANGDTKIFPVGQKNVARWRDSYDYNPSCQSK
jgi:hypothetical protein